uniref:Lysosomal acid phosphatase n=1 Tax=Meloidogyne hapla TaxID=6305 RepID=A0A1I8BEG7_MELHA
MYLLLLLLILVSGYTSTLENITTGEDRLLLVHVIWRHGDRAPITTYPTDPNGENRWPFGFGELTELGMRQQYSLGHLLRKRYIIDNHFISERYTPKEVYIRSTDVNRTLASAQANLAGMFPTGVPGIDIPDLPKKWPSRWTPIPIHTVPVSTDNIGNLDAYCPRAEQLFTKIKKSSAYLNVQKENTKFFEYISQKAGKNYTLENIAELDDVIYIEKLYNMTQPEWLTKEIQQHIYNLTFIANDFYFGIQQQIYSLEMIRLRGGNLLGDVVKRIKLKLECLNKTNENKCIWINNLKYFAYSAHDTTVAGFLCTLGDEESVAGTALPHYTASISIELWQTKLYGPAVKILYHPAFHEKYYPITGLTKGCPEGNDLCPANVFTDRSIKFIPININKECKKREEKKEKSKQRKR